jgi:predicted phosphodiesterase
MTNKYLYIIFSVLFLLFLSCNKVKSTTPNLNNVVLNNTEINEDAPIIIYGDTRNNYEVHKRIVKAFLEKNPTIVFNTGDLVYDGDNISLWPIFLDIIKPILKTSRYYPVIGNHERESVSYFKIFKLPNNEKWYTIDYKNIRFFLLDTNSDLSVNSKQYLWLENKLKESNSDFKVLVTHDPIFSAGRHGGSSSLKKSLIPLIKKYSVKLIFSGHDHAYQRFLKDDTNYIVTGGGGAPLYDKKENSKDQEYLKTYQKTYHFCLLESKNDTLSINIYDINNTLIDNITIKK